ncbi:MAG: hypothetical protein IKL79_06920, partial [Clostridia bacterium]|nr:hypothetical protein [Clostridia bacterium]
FQMIRNNPYATYIQTADIDFDGRYFMALPEFYGEYFGNGYKISNLTVESKGTTFNPTLAIFKELSEGAAIRSVSFEEVEYVLNVNTEIPNLNVKAAALALSLGSGVTVTDVSISGALTTNYSGELSCLEKVFYYTEPEDEALLGGVNGFAASITVNYTAADENDN